MKAKLMLIAVLCAVALCPKPAQAYPITIQIEAVVDTVEDNGSGNGYLDGQIQVGDTITGYYTYESTTPDTNPLSYIGHYCHYALPAGVLLTAGSFEFKTDPGNVEFIVGVGNNSVSGGLHDSYGLISYNNLSLANGASVDSISWSLRDSSASALSGIDLPTTAPVLDDWQSRNRLRLHGERGEYIIDAHVTSAVPEPATLLLVGIGALLLRKFK